MATVNRDALSDVGRRLDEHLAANNLATRMLLVGAGTPPDEIDAAMADLTRQWDWWRHSVIAVAAEQSAITQAETVTGD